MSVNVCQVTREVINIDKAPAAVGTYSQAVRANDVLYVSGSLGLIPETGEMIPGGVVAECRQSLINMGHVLTAVGADFNNVVKVTVLLADINDFAAMNNVYKEFFTKDYPARAAYQVAKLPLNARVEIEAIAVLGDIEEKQCSSAGWSTVISKTSFLFNIVFVAFVYSV